MTNFNIPMHNNPPEQSNDFDIAKTMELLQKFSDVTTTFRAIRSAVDLDVYELTEKLKADTKPVFLVMPARPAVKLHSVEHKYRKGAPVNKTPVTEDEPFVATSFRHADFHFGPNLLPDNDLIHFIRETTISTAEGHEMNDRSWLAVPASRLCDIRIDEVRGDERVTIWLGERVSQASAEVDQI